MSDMKMSKNVKKILGRLDKSKKHKQVYLKPWEELDRFYRGDQYKNTKLPEWVPKPVTNYIHLVVTTKRASMAGDNPMATLRPLGPNDVRSISEMQRIYEWVWKRVKARAVVRDNIETSRLLGTGIAHVYWDENTGVQGGNGALFEGEIRVKEIDPMNFHVDPNAYRLEDAAWVHVTEKRSRDWVESEFGVDLNEISSEKDNYGEKYTREYFNDAEGEGKNDDGQIDFHAHYERYWNTEKMVEEQPIVDMITDPATGNVIEQPTEETVEVEGEEIGGWNYRVTYVAGTKEVGKIDPLEPNMYPFAVLYDIKQRQEFWGRSVASLILENQKLINKVESIIAMIGTLLQNPQKIVARDSGIDPAEATRFGTAPGHTFVSNVHPDNAMKWAQAPQIPQTLVNLAEMAKENIREITGMNEAYMGQSVGSLQTSSGVNSLIDRATMRDRDEMYEIEQYVEQLSRILMGFVTTKYTEERFIRIVQDPNRPEDTTDFLEFVGTEFAGIEFDMDIDVSAHAPISQARREAELTELMQLQGQYNMIPKIITPQEFIRGKRMVDATEIIDRMNREEERNEIDISTKAATMIAEAMMNGVPQQDIDQMAAELIRGLKSGEIPIDEDMAAMGGGGIGSAADNTGQMQAMQGSL